MDVLLRATAVVRSAARQLFDWVRRLEQIADDRILHLYRGSCPNPAGLTCLQVNK